MTYLKAKISHMGQTIEMKQSKKEIILFISANVYAHITV